MANNMDTRKADSDTNTTVTKAPSNRMFMFMFRQATITRSHSSRLVVVDDRLQLLYLICFIFVKMIDCVSDLNVRLLILHGEE